MESLGPGWRGGWVVANIVYAGSSCYPSTCCPQTPPMRTISTNSFCLQVSLRCLGEEGLPGWVLLGPALTICCTIEYSGYWRGDTQDLGICSHRFWLTMTLYSLRCFILNYYNISFLPSFHSFLAGISPALPSTAAMISATSGSPLLAIAVGKKERKKARVRLKRDPGQQPGQVTQAVTHRVIWVITIVQHGGEGGLTTSQELQTILLPFCPWSVACCLS